jgi:capsule polysaccharide modification protein KpsS
MAENITRRYVSAEHNGRVFYVYDANRDHTLTITAQRTTGVRGAQYQECPVIVVWVNGERMEFTCASDDAADDIFCRLNEILEDY